MNSKEIITILRSDEVLISSIINPYKNIKKTYNSLTLEIEIDKSKDPSSIDDLPDKNSIYLSSEIRSELKDKWAPYHQVMFGDNKKGFLDRDAHYVLIKRNKKINYIMNLSESGARKGYIEIEKIKSTMINSNAENFYSNLMRKLEEKEGQDEGVIWKEQKRLREELLMNPAYSVFLDDKGISYENINEVDNNGNTAIMNIVSSGWPIEYIRDFIVNNNLNLNVINLKKEHILKLTKDIKLIELLINKGADPLLRNKYNKTVLDGIFDRHIKSKIEEILLLSNLPSVSTKVIGSL